MTEHTPTDGLDHTLQAAALTRTAQAMLDGIATHRDEAIRVAYTNGLPLRAIAEAAGISHTQVARIINTNTQPEEAPK